jgi:hypothetical protein
MSAHPRHKDSPRNHHNTARNRDSRREQREVDAFSFTLDASTGRVVKVETLDASGTRREVSEQEKANLARERTERIEDALEQAFAAGIECVLGGVDEVSEVGETDKDAAIRHVLVNPLMRDSTANRLLQREVLDRAILETLLNRSITSGSVPGSGMETDSEATPPVL